MKITKHVSLTTYLPKSILIPFSPYLIGDISKFRGLRMFLAPFVIPRVTVFPCIICSRRIANPMICPLRALHFQDRTRLRDHSPPAGNLFTRDRVQAISPREGHFK
jgi:hypothetical protein